MGWLESREVPTDLLHDGGREIGIEGESAERGDLSVKVRLNPQNYLTALDAHRTRRLVRVKGEVRRTARGNSFTGESSLECVSAWNKDPVSGVIGIQKGPL